VNKTAANPQAQTISKVHFASRLFTYNL